MALGTNLRAARLAASLTLEELSDRSGVDIGTISALEMRDSLRSKYATALARALDLTVEQLEAGLLPARVQRVEEAPARYGPPWPLPGITPQQWNALSDSERSEVIGFVKGLLRSKRHAA
jgi:transcriptional regulator with XRE-family HTH domain